MYFLGAFFNEVHAFKPATSKPANSEVYLVAKGFKVCRPQTSMVNKLPVESLVVQVLLSEGTCCE